MIHRHRNSLALIEWLGDSLPQPFSELKFILSLGLFQIKETLSQEISEDLLDKEIDITTLAPLKPDWDLKRDIAEKLEKLGRRTRRAVAELIRERLRENKEDLARVVQNARPDADDDED